MEEVIIEVSRSHRSTHFVPGVGVVLQGHAVILDLKETTTLLLVHWSEVHWSEVHWEELAPGSMALILI